MSLIRGRKPLGLYTFCRVPTPPILGSANGLHTSAATSEAQMVSESTKATRGVVQYSQPVRSACRLPGTSVTTIVTGYRQPIAMQASSVASITSTISSTPFASQDSIARAKMTGSSWYTGTTTDIGNQKSFSTGL